MSEVILDTVQVALFPLNFTIESSPDLASGLDGFLDQSPKQMRVDSFLDTGGPKDIVRIRSLVKDKPHIEVQLSPAKISLFWRNETSAVDYQVQIEEVVEVVKGLVSKLEELGSDQINFGRVGYITTIFKPVEEPADGLSKLLTDNKDIMIKNQCISDLQLTVTYDFDKEMRPKVDESISYNKHIKLNQGRANKLDNKKVLIVEYDLNTRQADKQPPNVTVEWNVEKVEKFITEAAALSDKDHIYGQYFPSR